MYNCTFGVAMCYGPHAPKHGHQPGNVDSGAVGRDATYDIRPIEAKNELRTLRTCHHMIIADVHIVTVRSGLLSHT